jgi:ribosomal protein S18 acetylase RimI-like enzyme
MKIDIRQAIVTDAGLIADLSRQTFYETFALHNTKENMDKFMNEQFTKDALMKEVGMKGNIFLLAMNDDNPLGYVRMRESDPPKELGKTESIEIARIYATTSSIGKGVGSALMKECIAIAKEKGKQVIWLGVWEKNQLAIDFYLRWGFEKFGEHDFILGKDVQTDWLMKCPLSP